MDDNVQDLILYELRGMRREVGETLDKYGNRLTAIETKIEPLFPNGQQGVLAEMRDDIDSLNSFKYYFVGGVAALEAAGHWFGKKLGL